MRVSSVRLLPVLLAVGVIGAGVGAGAAAATPGPATEFSPTFSLGTAGRGGSPDCIGMLDASVSVDPDWQYGGPVWVLLRPHYIGGMPCYVDGNVAWTNLDTGATGDYPFALSGTDTAPTGGGFDPGQGRISLRIEADHGLITGSTQITV